MGRIRKIHRKLSEGLNFYVIDACFLANKYIKPDLAQKPDEKSRIEKCMLWWKEIDRQLKNNKARVYIPDLCIAEAFKTLARKYYVDKWFKNSASYNSAKNRLASEITTSPEALRSFDRKIRYHDISTSRDLIIAVDRFFEVFLRYHPNVSIIDLIVLATAKYLMDFYSLPKSRVHIVTCDRPLRTGSKKIQELPYVYDPTDPKDEISKVFTD
jgi:hypothetical protein